MPDNEAPARLLKSPTVFALHLLLAVRRARSGARAVVKALQHLRLLYGTPAGEINDSSYRCRAVWILQTLRGAAAELSCAQTVLEMLGFHPSISTRLLPLLLSKLTADPRFSGHGPTPGEGLLASLPGGERPAKRAREVWECESFGFVFDYKGTDEVAVLKTHASWAKIISQAHSKTYHNCSAEKINSYILDQIYDLEEKNYAGIVHGARVALSSIPTFGDYAVTVAEMQTGVEVPQPPAPAPTLPNEPRTPNVGGLAPNEESMENSYVPTELYDD